MKDFFEQRENMKIVCYGDSITYGYETPITQSKRNYPALLKGRLESELKKEIQVINSGCNSMTSDWGVANLQNLVIDHSPDIAIVMFGINDAVYVGSEQQYLTNLFQIHNRLKEQNIESVFLTPTPIIALNAKRVEQFAKSAKKLFSENNFNWIDINKAVKENIDNQKIALTYLPDLYHPIYHYDDIAKVVCEYLTSN